MSRTNICGVVGTLFDAGESVNLMFTPQGVLHAYCEGLFPMHDSRSGEILWYRPDPRAVFPLDQFHTSRSLAKRMRSGVFEVTFNSDFEGVMRGCAVRDEGTWISEEFIEVYGSLHRSGVAQSVEVWRDEQLVGGAYGISIGGAFMAESMFHRETDASKVALAALVNRLKSRGFALLDTQYLTEHLVSLGAIEIPHREYYNQLQHAIRLDCTFA